MIRSGAKHKLLWNVCGALAATLAIWASGPAVAQTAESKHLAPGFTERTAGSKLVVIPVDMELFSISAGGVQEPKADWTQDAVKRFMTNLLADQGPVGGKAPTLTERELDEFAELNALHGAMAEAIFIHHGSPARTIPLPTKEGKLNWSMGDAVTELRKKTNADYALFTWVRDSYASPERKAAMVAMALLGVGLTGGAQVGYASLVDLRTGQVVWFNGLARQSGDLREPEGAKETVEALFRGFPAQSQ
jgi:hypothetical protein